MIVLFVSISPSILLAKEIKAISLSWSSFRSGEIFINIGFGNGKELIDLSTRNPNKNFLGIEAVSYTHLRAHET